MTHGPVRWNGDMRANLFQSSGLWWCVIRIECEKKEVVVVVVIVRKRRPYLFMAWSPKILAPFFHSTRFYWPRARSRLYLHPGGLFLFHCWLVGLPQILFFSHMLCFLNWVKLGDRRVMKEATVKAWIKDINSQQARQVVDSAKEQGIQIYNCRQYFFGPLGLMSAVLYIYRKSEYWFFRFTVLDGNDFPHIAMGEKTEKIYFSLLQACFVIAHSSGDFITRAFQRKRPSWNSGLVFFFFFFFLHYACATFWLRRMRDV